MFNFVGTRGNNDGVKMISDILLDPNAPLGGIFVPEEIPVLGVEFLKKYLNSSYESIAYYVINSLGLDIGNNTFFTALHTYDHFDFKDNPAPVVKVSNNTYVLELFHGPTRAFKDMALQPFGTLVSKLAVNKNQKYLVLAATSGDTGPAALESFKDKANIKVVCLYPNRGTSHVQKEQMVKMDADNLKVIGINGDFDDTQTALKKLLKSDSFKDKLKAKGFNLSAANSVNFGRIMFQIVYHFWSYLELVREGEIKLGDSVKSIIPSGNFGNGIAAYYAMQMGLPISKIILASNSNNVLTDFIKTGMYDLRKRELIKTSSPAMDILKSSNIERLLYHICGSSRTNELMINLENEKYFMLESIEYQRIQEVFDASYATDNEVAVYVKHIFDNYDYICDPHTATAFVIKSKLEINDITIISSTAEWTKFSPTLAKVFDMKDDLSLLSDKFDQNLTPHIKKLESMPVIHTDVIDKEQIQDSILEFV